MQIKNWKILKVHNNDIVASGILIHDEQDRFEDETNIITSVIKSYNIIDEKHIITTANSVYELI